MKMDEITTSGFSVGRRVSVSEPSPQEQIVRLSDCSPKANKSEN